MRTNMRLIISTFLFISISSFLQATDTIKIAAIGAKTGDASQSYRVFFPAMRFTIDEINKKGGLLGKQIELLEYDNKSSTLGSKLAAQKAVQQGVICTIGAFWSSHSIAIAEIMQNAKIPMISPLSTNPAVTLVGDYIFRVCFIDSFQGTAMANFATNYLKAETAIILTQSGDIYSNGLSDFFKQNFSKNGTVLWEGTFFKGSVDFANVVTNIRKYNPDIVFLPGYVRESGFIIRQSHNSGVKSVFLGGDGWNKEMLEYGKDTLKGSYFSQHWDKGSENEKSKELIKKFEQSEYGDLVEFNAGIPLTYDAVQLLADAVRRADSFNSKKIREALASTTNYLGATGRITFDKNRNPIKSVVINQFNIDDIIYVKTIDP